MKQPVIRKIVRKIYITFFFCSSHSHNSQLQFLILGCKLSKPFYRFEHSFSFFFNKSKIIFINSSIFSLSTWENVLGTKQTILSEAGMSNSNHCAGRTLSFKARKAYRRASVWKNMLLCVKFRHILANFILKWTKIGHI